MHPDLQRYEIQYRQERIQQTRNLDYSGLNHFVAATLVGLRQMLSPIAQTTTRILARPVLIFRSRFPRCKEITCPA